MENYVVRGQDNPHEPYFTDMNTFDRVRNPHRYEIRRANLIKANKNWDKLRNNLAKVNDSEPTLKSSDNVRTRNIKNGLTSEGLKININKEIIDYRKNLRSIPSGLDPKRITNTRMSRLEKDSAKIVNSPDPNVFSDYMEHNGSLYIVETPVIRAGVSYPRFNVNVRTGPGKSILKNPKNISDLHWNRLLNAAQNVDLDDVDVSRLSREIGQDASALDSDVINEVHLVPRITLEIRIQSEMILFSRIDLNSKESFLRMRVSCQKMPLRLSTRLRVMLSKTLQIPRRMWQTLLMF